MRETSKCWAWRHAQGHFQRYLCGNGIDVGCGGDRLVTGTGRVRGWDKADGDGQYMAGVADDTYDFVYSSHALEHMLDVPTTLQHWQRILRPGGFLYVVVPDYLLYEKLNFPSRYNDDHKHTFSLSIPRSKVARINHWTPAELWLLLGPVVEYALQDTGFDYSRGLEDQTRGAALAQLYFVAQKPACHHHES